MTSRDRLYYHPPRPEGDCGRTGTRSLRVVPGQPVVRPGGGDTEPRVTAETDGSADVVLRLVSDDTRLVRVQVPPFTDRTLVPPGPAPARLSVSP